MVSVARVRQAANVRPLDRRQLLVKAAGAVAAGNVLARLPDAAWAAGALDPRVVELRGLVQGPVLAPGSAAYGAARPVYNERFDAVRPLAIVKPRGVTDVQAVVRWAQRRRVAVVPRSGGHSYAGYSTGTGVVLDLSDLRGIRLEGASAVVGAGSRL